jgi:hypothetical protein
MKNCISKRVKNNKSFDIDGAHVLLAFQSNHLASRPASPQTNVFILLWTCLLLLLLKYRAGGMGEKEIKLLARWSLRII